MQNNNNFEVIIVGGSYSGLAAAMALGRALRRVLVIDGGMPCNRQTPHSHNFLTQDGGTPAEISRIAREQVSAYDTVFFRNDFVNKGIKTPRGFELRTDSGEVFTSAKLVFATGVYDIMPAIKGYDECWGISALHCPYCHGYEVRNQPTGVIANGEMGFQYAALIYNWTKELTLFTNGKSTLTHEQELKLAEHNISMIENEVVELLHNDGYVYAMNFRDRPQIDLKAVYSHVAFRQHSSVPEQLGCEINEDGYITVDAFQKTSVPGVFACGDNTTRLRTVSNSVAMGSTAGMMLNRELVLEEF